MAALARLHIDGGIASFMQADVIHIGVFLAFHVNVDEMLALAGRALGIPAYATGEVEAFAPTVWHTVGSAKEWQVGDDGIARHCDGIGTGEIDDAGPSVGVCPVDVDGIMSARQAVCHFLFHQGSAGGLLCTC